MAKFKRLPRLKAPSPNLQRWADAIRAAVETALNLTFSGQVTTIQTTSGMHVKIEHPAILKDAILTTSLPAMTGSAPGSASVTLQDWNATAFVAGDTVTLYNSYATAFDGTTTPVRLKVGWQQGDWFLVGANC